MAIAKQKKKGGALCLIIAALLAPLSCKEASRVLTNDVFTAYSGNPPGDFRLLVNAGLPANGSTGVPINSHYVIVFNIPADPTTISSGVVITSYPTATGVPITTLAEGAAADYELSMNAENTLLTVSFHYGGAYPLPENTTATITLGNTIVSLITAENPVSVPLDNPGSWQFGTGAFPDTAPPAESAHNPAGAGISLTAPGIYIEFNEDLDPDSASPLTLLLLDGATPVPAAVAYDTFTRRASLTPSINLNTSTLYTVTATTGLMDLAGNSFAGTSWTFTTTATSLDPTPGNPAFSSGPYIDTVSPNGALMTWTTNKPASYILNYGMNSGVTDQYDETLEPFPYSEYHSFYFATPELAYDLDPNTRYWFDIELYDMYGGSTTSMATLEFNTESGETPDTVHGGTGS
ncbi:MAG: Ig-like domain-containing protein, partial [Spirochaetes bacterium]|nr:Ig-like domain-containing protein [Spirochaetota bacterium]